MAARWSRPLSGVRSRSHATAMTQTGRDRAARRLRGNAPGAPIEFERLADLSAEDHAIERAIAITIEPADPLAPTCPSTASGFRRVMNDGGTVCCEAFTTNAVRGPVPDV